MSRIFLVFSSSAHIHISQMHRHSSALRIDTLQYIHNINTSYGIYTLFSIQCKHLSGIQFCGLLSRPHSHTWRMHTHIQAVEAATFMYRLTVKTLNATMQLDCFFFCVLLFCDMLLKISPIRFNRNKFRMKNAMRPNFFFWLSTNMWWLIIGIKKSN